MKFGMPTLIEIESLEETFVLCKSLGLDFIELNMNLPQYQPQLLEDTKYFSELAEKYGIFYTIHLDENLNICDFNKVVAKAYTETVMKTIEVAKKLNVPLLNMHMNHGVHFTLPDRKIQLYDKYNDEYMNAWTVFRDSCEKSIGNSNIKISIENTDGFRDYEVKTIEYLLKSKAFVLTFDIGHSQAVGNTDEVFIMKHSDKLSHFHIHDGLSGKDHMILGTGKVDLIERLSLAERYNARCVVETKTVDALKLSVEWLKNNNYIRS